MALAKFIGGALDGEVRDIDDQAWHRGVWRAPMLRQAKAVDPSTGLAPFEPLPIDVVTYVRRVICDVDVWAPESMRPPQVVELLVQRYGNKRR